MQSECRLNQPKREKIERLLGRRAELPSIPAVVFKVVQETRDSNSNASSIATLLAQDQAMTARILRMANSAFFGMSKKVVQIQEAVVLLGFKNVSRLALLAGTFPWLKRPAAGYLLGPKELWSRSIGIAVGAKVVAERVKIDTEAAFTAGLMADIGKVALSGALENRAFEIRSIIEKLGVGFDQAESYMLGFDHSDVGAFLAESWGFPAELIECIQYHHQPDEVEGNKLVDCVHIGDYLAMCMGLGLGFDGMGYEISENALSRLGLGADDLDRLTDEFVSQYEKHEQIFAELSGE